MYDWKISLSKLKDDCYRIQVLNKAYDSLLNQLDSENANLFPYDGVSALDQIVQRLARDKFDIRRRVSIVRATYNYLLSPRFEVHDQAYSYDINFFGKSIKVHSVTKKKPHPDTLEMRLSVDGDCYSISYKDGKGPVTKSFKRGSMIFGEDIVSSGKNLVKNTESLRAVGVKKTREKGVFYLNAWQYNLGTGYASQPVMVFLDGNRAYPYNFSGRSIEIISAKPQSQVPRL